MAFTSRRRERRAGGPPGIGNAGQSAPAVILPLALALAYVPTAGFGAAAHADAACLLGAIGPWAPLLDDISPDGWQLPPKGTLEFDYVTWKRGLEASFRLDLANP